MMVRPETVSLAIGGVLLIVRCDDAAYLNAVRDRYEGFRVALGKRAEPVVYEIVVEVQDELLPGSEATPVVEIVSDVIAIRRRDFSVNLDVAARRLSGTVARSMLLLRFNAPRLLYAHPDRSERAPDRRLVDHQLRTSLPLLRCVRLRQDDDDPAVGSTPDPIGRADPGAQDRRRVPCLRHPVLGRAPEERRTGARRSPKRFCCDRTRASFSKSSRPPNPSETSCRASSSS